MTCSLLARIHETREELRQRKVMEKRMEKKKRLKEMFNKEYDDTDGQGTYFDALKLEMEGQAQVCILAPDSDRPKSEHLDH